MNEMAANETRAGEGTVGPPHTREATSNKRTPATRTLQHLMSASSGDTSYITYLSKDKPGRFGRRDCCKQQQCSLPPPLLVELVDPTTKPCTSVRVTLSTAAFPSKCSKKKSIKTPQSIRCVVYQSQRFITIE